jgi:uncharacterized protein YceK
MEYVEMSTKNICLALVALVLTVGAGTVAQAHRASMQQAAATAPAACTTSYSSDTDAAGRSISLVNLTCSRSAPRLASGTAL